MERKEVIEKVARGVVVFTASVLGNVVGRLIAGKTVAVAEAVKKYLTEKTPEEEVSPFFED